jgi:competence protein ComEC
VTRPGTAKADGWRRLTWVDLRLVPAVAAVWAGALAAPWIPSWPLMAAALTCGVLAAVIAGRRGGPSGAVGLAVLAGIAVSAATGAVHGWQRETSLLRDPTVVGRTVDAVLELDGDLRLLGGGAAPRGIADATVVGIVGPQGVREVDAIVLLFAPVQGWREVLPGQQVRARVSVAVPRPGDTVTAVVSARGPPTAVAAPAWWRRPRVRCARGWRRRPRGCSRLARRACCRGWSSATPAGPIRCSRRTSAAPGSRT